MDWGAIFLFLCALGVLACFALIAAKAITEYRRIEDYTTSPWGDVVEVHHEAKAAGGDKSIAEGGGRFRAHRPPNAQVTNRTHDEGATTS